MRYRFSPIQRAPPDPDAALFLSIRHRLTLWYGAVLAAVLILFGVALYVGENQALLRPINNDLAARADAVREAWQAHSAGPCPGTASGSKYWACFSSGGRLLDHSDEIGDVPSLLAPSFAQAALQSNTKSNTISGGDAGILRRYAKVIGRPGGGTLGIVVLATPVQGELDALHLLLILLLILGGLALLTGTIGGLFLSGRALKPARMALQRQQAFIADASHELRTPLSLLRADADLLRQERDRLSDQGAMLLDDIVAEVTHMGGLSDNMLTLAELSSGELRLEHDVVDFAEIALSVAQRASALAATNAVAVRSKFTTQALVIGDSLLLEQAALILVDNAIKYNRAGGSVCVEARIDCGRAILSVRDTGIGIATEHLGRFGERFFRVDASRSRHAGGAGLGLSIARRIATLHDGKLLVESKEGVETRVLLVLPLATPN